MDATQLMIVVMPRHVRMHSSNYRPLGIAVCTLGGGEIWSRLFMLGGGVCSREGVSALGSVMLRLVSQHANSQKSPPVEKHYTKHEDWLTFGRCNNSLYPKWLLIQMKWIWVKFGFEASNIVRTQNANKVRNHGDSEPPWPQVICPSLIFCKGLTWPTLVIKRPECYHSTSKKRVRDRIFKLSLIHASVIYQIPWLLLKSLNSMKALLHLGKTQMSSSVCRCFL